MLWLWAFPFVYWLYKIYNRFEKWGEYRGNLYVVNYRPRVEEVKEVEEVQVEEVQVEEVVEDDHLEEEKEAINPLPVLFYPNFTNIKNDINHETCHSEIYDGDMALPVLKVKDDCAFWLDPMNEENENIKNTEWGHKFHFDWFGFYAELKAKNGKIACPLCRREVKV